MNYPDFFQAATGNKPYRWQCRLACGEPPSDANSDLDSPDEFTRQWLSGSAPCVSRLIDIPTGLGKTAGVVLAWLWNFLHSVQKDTAASQPGKNGTSEPKWPRRLVYCLPMRTLVEQTAGHVEVWLWNLLKEYPENQDLRWLCGLSEWDPIPDHGSPPRGRMRSPVILMGGEDQSQPKRDWDIYPEKPTILIGTQDMLLSRALNRGYGMSRYRWPMHFALLNNDALWVMDEVQLMGAGLAATTQLEGFRKAEELGSRSWWMSATIRPDWLQTVDMPADILKSDSVKLETNETKQGRVQILLQAGKSLFKAPLASGAKSEKELARFVFDQHSATGLNLVVLNTVKRARETHKELAKLLHKEPWRLLVLHSQFRPEDRQRVMADAMREPAGKIVISTQVIEAGVDLSAHKLFTELAPWSSLVQRFGRCNRWLIDGRPHHSDAAIHWFDLTEEKDHPPYSSETLAAARELITQLAACTANAAIENLDAIGSPDEDRPRFRHVVRRKDLIELFDTTPDIAGADLDIDRFIRDADSSHIQVFWRDWSGNDPNGSDEHDLEPESAPRCRELCSTTLIELRSLLSKTGMAWRWNHLDREWQPVKPDDVYPGQIYLLHTSQGGYEEGSANALPLGWTGDPKHKPSSLEFAEKSEAETPDGNEDDHPSQIEHWQTLAQHTDAVCHTLDQLLADLGDETPQLPAEFSKSLPDILHQAARWHDWGKAHAAFQAKLKESALLSPLALNCGLENPLCVIAKAPKDAWKKGRLPYKPKLDENRRKHFRHELASALAVLHPGSGFPFAEPIDRDLAAYLIAAHHGKVRLSIRSLPDEWTPPTDSDHPRERRFARGVWDADPLAAVALDQEAHVSSQAITLSLEPMELGLCEEEPFKDQPSWAERALKLRDTLGPFLLAWLETLIRAADGRASRIAQSARATSENSSASMKLREEPQSDAPLTPSETALVSELVQDGLSIQDKFRPEPLYKQTGKGHYQSDTVEEIRQAKKRKGKQDP